MPLSHHKVVDRDDLAREQWLLIEDGHCLRSHSLQACRIVDPSRNEVFHATSLRTLFQMVGAWHHANASDRGRVGIRFNSQCCYSAAFSRQAVSDLGPSLAVDILARRRIQGARKYYPRVLDGHRREHLRLTGTLKRHLRAKLVRHVRANVAPPVRYLGPYYGSFALSASRFLC
jgi:hypothetical protein